MVVTKGGVPAAGKNSALMVEKSDETELVDMLHFMDKYVENKWLSNFF